MLIWIRENKRRVAQWFVWPLVVVFIALYGSSQVQNQMAMNERTAVKVNGERVSLAQYHTIDQEISRYYTNSPVKPEKPRNQLAVEQVIEQELARQLANDLGLWTEDSLVDQVIIQQMSGGSGVVNETVYRRFLQESGFQTSEAYREYLRNRMNVQLALNYIRGTAVPSEADIERNLRAARETRRVEMLAFESADYLDQVEATTDELKAYFEQHHERYHLPKRMKLHYLELGADDFIGAVTPEAESLERWFRSEQGDFQVPAERDVRAVVFSAGSFRDQVTFTEEELQTYYQSNQSEYEEPAKYRVRFVAASVEVPDASIVAEMEKSPEEFKSKSEAVSARHILLKTDATAGPEDLAAIKGKADEIRGRIVTEEDFIREAKAHSEDPSNNLKGGDLGFFEKGRMVPEFEVAAFSLPEATVSQPIKTAFGYHLIWVNGRRGEGERISPTEARFRVLQNIDTTPLKERAQTQLNGIKAALGAGGSLASASAVTEIPVIETDWFSSGETPHPDVANDRFAFNQAVPNLQAGQVSDIVEGFSSFYLIELIEKTDPRQKTYEEVRGDVETAYRTEKAGTLAREKATEAAGKVRDGSLTFEQIPATYGLSEPVLYSQLRAPGTPALQKNTRVDREIVNRAFAMEPGTVEGPFDTLQGSTLIEIVRDEPERLPELEEVRGEAEQAYRRVLAERKANEEVWNVWSAMDTKKRGLASAAVEASYEIKTTDFFRPGEVVPGFSRDSVVNFVAAGLRVAGATSEVLEDPPPDPENPDREIRAYLILEAATIEESHLPSFEEVKGTVREDALREKAAALASQDAEKALALVSAKLASATAPLSASKSIDFSELATANEFKLKGPFPLPFTVDSSSIAGTNSAAAVSATVYSLPLGGVSGLVAAKEYAPEGTGVAERIHGYYIAQVVDIDQPATGGSSRGETFRTLTTGVQDAIQTDWSDRARRLAEIVLNENLFDEESAKTILESLDKG